MENQNYKTALSVFVQSIKAGTKFHEYALEVGMTPPVLVNLGLPALPLMISVKEIDKCHFDHGVTLATLNRLYDLVANPNAVFASDSPHLDHTKVTAAVVITIETKNGNPILVAVHADQMLGRTKVNLVKSVYDKPGGVVQGWRTKGLLLWEKPAAPVSQATVTPLTPAVAAPVVTIKKTRTITNN